MPVSCRVSYITICPSASKDRSLFVKMVQLKDIAIELRSKLDGAIMNLKKRSQSKPIDPDRDQAGSSCSPNTNGSAQASRLLGSVMDTLFGACTGNKCTPTPEMGESDAIKTIKLGAKTSRALQSLHKSSSNESRERDDVRRNANVNNEPKNIPIQHKEKIRVGGAPYRLCEVSATNKYGTGEEESEVSFNFDDGISALSAHTLEEMAKAEKILLKKRGYQVPREEGFDISLEASVLDENKADGPPSPASTVESDDVTPTRDAEERVGPLKKNYAETSSYEPTKSYPVQMARSRRESSPDGSVSTASDFSSAWRIQEQNYWLQVAEQGDQDESRDVVSATSPLSTMNSSCVVKMSNEMCFSSEHR